MHVSSLTKQSLAHVMAGAHAAAAEPCAKEPVAKEIREKKSDQESKLEKAQDYGISIATAKWKLLRALE